MGVLVPSIVSLRIGSSFTMIGLSSISSLVLPPFKLRDGYPFYKIFSIDLVVVFPSFSTINPA
jgi:hypothetical protein